MEKNAVVILLLIKITIKIKYFIFSFISIGAIYFFSKNSYNVIFYGK